MKKILFCLLFALIPHLGFSSLKTLVLVISCDKDPLYQELMGIWRSYMHLDPDHIEAYFIQADPALPQKAMIVEDVLWTRGVEGWTPQSSGILDKTIRSLEALSSRLPEFDYVLRTSLSSFYIFPRLLRYLEALPRTRCYSASPIFPGNSIGSGSGFILSRDLAQLLVDKKQLLLGIRSEPDDVIIGKFLNQRRIGLIAHPRLDFLALQNFLVWDQNLSESCFQIRVKTAPEMRFVEDLYIQRQLLKIFYVAPEFLR